MEAWALTLAEFGARGLARVGYIRAERLRRILAGNRVAILVDLHRAAVIAGADAEAEDAGARPVRLVLHAKRSGQRNVRGPTIVARRTGITIARYRKAV